MTYVYGKLVKIDYNDYIYGIYSNVNSLHQIISSNPMHKSKTSSIVVANIVLQNCSINWSSRFSIK